MRVAQSWLTEVLGELPPAAETAEAFVAIGHELEGVDVPPAIVGPLVVGVVREIEELTSFKKPIRYCQVQVGPGAEDVNGIICGARNFAVGDLVVVALPGAVLPDDFTISARQTYGHTSNGMLASAAELGLGNDHAGIIVLPPGTATPGDDALALIGADDAVIDLEITPDRGYCLSVRGLARELAAVGDREVRDLAARYDVPDADGAAWPVELADDGCARFVARRVDGVDARAAAPWWMQRRLRQAGIRSISLVVDVTNYVMLELGQPLHAYSVDRLSGPIVVRRAVAGEQLTTLDGVTRRLDPDDLLITDDSGPIGLAGVMGGASTEIATELAEDSPDTVDVLIEAAHFRAPVISRGHRRHRLPSEASKRFERGVDPQLPPVAAERAAQLLVEFGGATIAPGRTDVGAAPDPAPVTMAIDLPDRVAGVAYPPGATVRRLAQIGCAIQLLTGDDGRGQVVATPPSWRPDLTRPADLVEEVLRLEGYDQIPSQLPAAPAGRGLTPAQQRRRTVSRALAEAGYVEVLPFPFVDPRTWDAFGLPATDVRRRTVTVRNPLEADRNALTSTLLPGLLDAVVRNRSRGAQDLALYTVGQVVLPRANPPALPRPATGTRPSDAELAQLDAALPAQPLHVGLVLAGDREPAGWWGPGRAASWADAVAAAQLVGAAAHTELRVTAAEHAPFHPGRCAALRVGEWIVGHAGELHPQVVEALGLPPRTCAAELNLDGMPLIEHRPAPVVPSHPPVAVDVALLVEQTVPAAALVDALVDGGGPLLEDVAPFDVYTGEQAGAGHRSVAFRLRFRAPDRTLTHEEANAARDAAVAVAAQRHGATLRS